MEKGVLRVVGLGCGFVRVDCSGIEDFRLNESARRCFVFKCSKKADEGVVAAEKLLVLLRVDVTKARGEPVVQRA